MQESWRLLFIVGRRGSGRRAEETLSERPSGQDGRAVVNGQTVDEIREWRGVSGDGGQKVNAMRIASALWGYGCGYMVIDILVDILECQPKPIELLLCRINGNGHCCNDPGAGPVVVAFQSMVLGNEVPGFDVEETTAATLDLRNAQKRSKLQRDQK